MSDFWFIPSSSSRSEHLQQAEGEQTFFGGERSTPFFNKGNKNSKSKSAVNVQAKFSVGPSKDEYEKEADGMADKVVQRKELEQNSDQSPFFRINNNKNKLQPKCSECEKEEKEELQQNPEEKNEKEMVQPKCAESEKEEKIQTKPASPDSLSASSHIESSLNSSKGGGSPIPFGTKEEMENSFGTDFSNVRLHTDRMAAQMNNDLNAQAFTHGNDIYFNTGNYDTTREQGRHLLVHELTHTVQQKGGSKMISRETNVDRGDTAAPVPDPPKKIQYKEYVEKHALNITGLLGLRLSKNRYEIPVPHVSWKDGNSEKFAIDLWAPIWQKSKSIYDILNDILVPDSLYNPINYGRDAIAGEGTDEWKPGVISELDRYVSRRLIMAIRRLVPLYAHIMNKKQLQNEQDQTTKPIEPTEFELTANHPFEKYIIPALDGKLSINFVEFRKAYADGYPQISQPHALRPVVLEFQTHNLAPNWVKVISPIDPTKEEVSTELYGSELKAWTISGSAPYFMVPEHNVGEVMYAFKPKYEELYQKNRTLQPKWQPGDPVLPNEMSGGFVSDEIAFSQAKTIQPSGATASVILQRMRLSKMMLENCIGIFLMSPPLRPKINWLQQERERIIYRIEHLSKASDAAVMQWDAQSLGQFQLVSSAYEGLLMTEKQAAVFKDYEQVHSLVHEIGEAYTKVILNSSYYVTGKEQLDWANDISLLFPVRVMENLLKDIRGSIENARKDKTENLDPKLRESLYQIDPLTQKEREIRDKLAQLRILLLQNPEKAKELLTEVYNLIQNLQIGSILVTDMDTIDRLWKEVHESISFSGAIRSLWGGGNDILLEANESNNKLWSEWADIYKEWKYGDKEKAKAALIAKSNSDEWKNHFKKVAGILDDHRLIDKWMNLGLMVGIAILTGGLGAYVEGFAGAAWGVAGLTGRAALTSWRVWAASGIAVTTEAAVFTTLSTVVLEKDLILQKFLNSFGENLLMFGGLKAISKTYSAILGAEKAATVGGKVGNFAVQFSAMNGHALWKANKEKHEKTGKGLSWDEIMEISFMNLAFMVAVSVGGKLAESPIQKLVVHGKLQGGMSAVRLAEQKLQKVAGQVEANKGLNKDLNEQLRLRYEELMRAEENLMRDLIRISLNPKLAKAAGMSEKMITDLQSTFKSIQTAVVMAHLEPIATNEFICNSETFNRAKEMYSGQKDTTVQELPKDPLTQTRTMHVITPEKTIRIIERFAESKESMVPEPKPVTELPAVTEPAKPVAEKSFEHRLEELLNLNTEAKEPFNLKFSINRLRKFNIPDNTILAIIRNGFVHGDRSPTNFFTDLYQMGLSESKLGRTALESIVEGLTGDKNFFIARMLMERAALNQGGKVKNIISVFTIEEIGTMRRNFGSGSDADFTNAINVLITKIDAQSPQIFELLKEAGVGQASLDNLVEAVARLGIKKGKFAVAQVIESLSFDRQLKEAMANNSKADEVAKIIFGEKYGVKEGDTYKVSESLTGDKPGDQAAAFVRARKSMIASFLLGGDSGTAINKLTWNMIFEIITNTDLPPIVKNDIIGELWAFTKIREYNNKGYDFNDIIREVHFRWREPDGSWSKGYAKLDTVLRKGNFLKYKEFKSSDTASTSDEQKIVYDLLEKGLTDNLLPYGPNAEKAFGGKGMTDFKAQKVEFERPSDL